MRESIMKSQPFLMKPLNYGYNRNGQVLFLDFDQIRNCKQKLHTLVAQLQNFYHSFILAKTHIH